MEQRLELDDEMAAPFLKCKVGDKITMTVEAVMVSAEMRPDYDTGPSLGKNKPMAKKPHCTFVIAKVNGKEQDEDYKGMSSENFEKKVAKNRGY